MCFWFSIDLVLSKFLYSMKQFVLCVTCRLMQQSVTITMTQDEVSLKHLAIVHCFCLCNYSKDA